MARPLVLVVHAFGGHPAKFWYPRLREFISGTADVEVLSMTNAHTPKISAWVADLASRTATAASEAQEAAGCSPRDVFLVGHSVGCQAIVRFLALSGTSQVFAGGWLRLGGVLLVAAWFAVLDPWETIEPWCTTPFDCAAARTALGGSPMQVLLSDNDKYTPDFEQNAAQWLERLGATVRILPVRSPVLSLS
jgi:predicted alpha/beta hydrolase family esterase